MASEPAEEAQDRVRWGMRLDPTVNYGHLLSASVFLVSVSLAWAALSARQDHAETRIGRLERVQEEMVRDNLREAQVIARLEEKMTSLDRILVRIERLLERAQGDRDQSR